MGDSVKKYEEMTKNIDVKPNFKISDKSPDYPKMSDTVKQLEKEYPIIAEEFKEILLAQYELFSQKMLSYGMGNISMGSNLETKDKSPNCSSVMPDKTSAAPPTSVDCFKS